MIRIGSQSHARGLQQVITDVQGRELKHLKELSQAVLQQRSDIERFLLSSLEMVRKTFMLHCERHSAARARWLPRDDDAELSDAQVQAEIGKGHKDRRGSTAADTPAPPSGVLPAANHVDMRVRSAITARTKPVSGSENAGWHASNMREFRVVLAGFDVGGQGKGAAPAVCKAQRPRAAGIFREAAGAHPRLNNMASEARDTS